MQKKLKFTVEKTKGNARAGIIELNGHKIPTPVFMPVGTKATIKGMILDMLQDPKYVGDIPTINLILANTYHLFLRPGSEMVKKAGGLHKYENRPWLILTDSWGFQVFSLGLSKTWKSLANLRDEWVYFRSIHDGTKHFFSPEIVVDTQCALGSDIMMVLDVCSPPGVTAKKFKQHMFLTHKRAKQAFDHFMPMYDDVRGVLFPIVQWGTNLELREESLTYLSQFAHDGIAVGGVSVGESQEEIKKVVDFCGPKLPKDKPRYLMGIGNPEGISNAVASGFDMFDCVLPTRLGRHGMYYTDQGYQKINHSRNKENLDRLTNDCPCFACQNFTKAYLHHLHREKEMLGGILLTLHNIVYLQRLTAKLRQDILDS